MYIILNNEWLQGHQVYGLAIYGKFMYGEDAGYQCPYMHAYISMRGYVPSSTESPDMHYVKHKLVHSSTKVLTCIMLSIS
jgi:hypothetical protein